MDVEAEEEAPRVRSRPLRLPERYAGRPGSVRAQLGTRWKYLGPGVSTRLIGDKIYQKKKKSERTTSHKSFVPHCCA
jgi:hypothetical protein